MSVRQGRCFFFSLVSMGLCKSPGDRGPKREKKKNLLTFEKKADKRGKGVSGIAFGWCFSVGLLARDVQHITYYLLGINHHQRGFK